MMLYRMNVFLLDYYFFNFVYIYIYNSVWKGRGKQKNKTKKEDLLPLLLFFNSVNSPR